MNLSSEQVVRVLSHFPEGVFTLNHEWVITYANQAFSQLLGYDPEELIGSAVGQYLNDMSIMEACQAQVAKTGHCVEQQSDFVHRHGHAVRITKSVQRIEDEQGLSMLMVCARDDASTQQLGQALKVNATELEASNEALAQQVSEGTERLQKQMAYLRAFKKAVDTSALTWMLDGDMNVLDANGQLLRRTGYELRELLDRDFFDLWDGESDNLKSSLFDTLARHSAWKGVVSYHTKSGQTFYLDTTLAKIFDQGASEAKYVCIGYDVTALIESTQAMVRRLHFDGLTHLPNRLSLMEALHDEGQSDRIGLVLFNVDCFSELNACFGHNAGDSLLKALGQTLQEAFSSTEGVVSLYKLPVDEFALLLELDAVEAGFERQVAGFLQHLPHQRFQLDGQQVNVSVTAGWATTDTAGPEGREVLSGADMALKRAKARRQTFLAFDPTLKIKKTYQQNLNWIERLNRGLEEGRFVPFYQPIVDAKTHQVVKYECLLRLREGDDYVSPGAFLDIAKRLRLYHRLTQTMIDQVFAKIATTPHHYSVNLSIEDIADETMRQWLIDRIKTCADPGRLVLEIVESEGIQNYGTAREFIRAVRAQGVQVALDDFGAGYSNFAYMVQLDVDYLKIDGSIIRDICDNPASEVMTETILAFAHKLEVKTIAEFVSDEAVLECLTPFAIDEFQGFYFGKPSPEVA
ncbi:EAL domain-containing protein [Hydrogenovibrio halophilus]|uniref:EAL domain-containing protein n=1 Tax=Hydrogenovibrio halophilus TaxID=373391 RepID=UPI0003746A2A|nr:EAL domain-containing protein [Hydrogenovibrio halophilus]